MTCHVCRAEAVGRCYHCGRLYSATHDVKGYCTTCTSAVHVPLEDKVTTGPAPGSRSGRAWWRPKVEEDPGPPSCYRCDGLAHRVCRNCENLYCPEHAGPADLCDQCGRSARVAMWITLGILLVLLALAFVPLLSQ